MNMKVQKQLISQSYADGARPSIVKNTDFTTLKSPIKRASLKYQTSQGGDIEELKIENDRLKTTVMVLTQKLKLKEDDEYG